MIRRRTHARSKKGCQTCKERHVRCDERLPFWYESRFRFLAHPSLHDACSKLTLHIYQSLIFFFWQLHSGNCLRLGRECSYTESLPQKCRQKMDPAAPTLVKASQQARLAQISPQDFQIYYCAPHHTGIASSSLVIIQQASEVAKLRPIPLSMTLTIGQHYTPK